MTAHNRSLRGFASVTSHVPPVDWATVYQTELPRLYNYFRYRFGDTALAQDLTSITFEKAWRARDRYRQDLAAFSTWLLAIARNVANDHYRSVTRQLTPTPLDLISDQPAPDTLESTYLRRAELQHLGQLLQTLADRDRELLALKYGAELNNREIARLTGLSESNVGTLLFRLVTKLRERWDQDR